MKWSEEELAAAHQRHTRSPGWSAECLAPDELERLALGSVEAHERERLVDHLVGCRSCSQLLQELRSLSDWASTVSAVRPAVSYVRVWAIAALLLLAVGVYFVALPGGRSEPGEDKVRGTAGSLTPPRDARLSVAPERFEWPAQAVATGYLLKLFDDDAELQWSSELLAESTCELPPAVARTLATGRSYFWIVEITGPARRRELGPFTFEISGRNPPSHEGHIEPKTPPTSRQ